MEIIRGLINVKERHKGCVVTIGNFDGVHLGHQAILTLVKQKAKEKGVTSLLVCFEPQPKEFFDEFFGEKPEVGGAPARLTRFREKVELLEKYGIDSVLCFKFDEKTRSLTAAEFIDVLVSQLQVKALFVGDDWRFGHDRSGDFEMLQQAGLKHDFDVTDIHTLVYENSRVSSTRIRECLAAGDFGRAEKMLGYPFAITGKVIYGRQIGRTLNAPTANIQLHRYRAPIDGVYAVEVEGLDKRYQGVANVGVRPTVEEATLKPILEVHLFDFKENIYGAYVKVIFRHKIRDEKKFATMDELKSAIAEDMECVRQYFSAVAV